MVLLDGTHSPRAVGQLANALAPDLVQRALARAASIRSALSPAEAIPILRPLAGGLIDGKSFAIWPFCEPIEEIGPRWLMRRALTEPVLAWLREVVRQSARPIAGEKHDQIARQLCNMATDTALSTRVHLAARAALRRLDSGLWRPMHIAAHGDLHGGNLLIDAGDATDRAALAPEQRFVVIDWAGASLEGYPLFDLLRIGDSLRIPRSLLATEVAVHCALVGGTLQDAYAHGAAALADLGAHREYFPLERYATLADRTLLQLDSALTHAGGMLS